MLYDIYDQNNQVVGQVDAANIVEAWQLANKKFYETLVLDVRPVKKEQVRLPEERPISWGEWKYHAEALETFVREQKLWGEFLVWRERWEYLHPM